MTLTHDHSVASIDTPQAQAEALVAVLRERLHEAARAGRLTNEFANGIITGLVHANVVLDPARHLIMFARAIEAEAHDRRTNPVQDWHNPMAQNNMPSSAEVILTKYEDAAATQMADDLVNGPWPLF